MLGYNKKTRIVIYECWLEIICLCNKSREHWFMENTYWGNLMCFSGVVSHIHSENLTTMWMMVNQLKTIQDNKTKHSELFSLKMSKYPSLTKFINTVLCTQISQWTLAALSLDSHDNLIRTQIFNVQVGRTLYCSTILKRW